MTRELSTFYTMFQDIFAVLCV